MTEEDSPIIDFYPSTFQIDMNGKKMAWQGVALLPFIDEKRLLDGMAPFNDKLTQEEQHRNTWGNDVVYVFEEHPLYVSMEALYGKRKSPDVSHKNKSPWHFEMLTELLQPVPIDPKLGKGLNGSLLPNPECLPGSTFYSPLTSVNQPDIKSDRSLSALYFFPKQLTPHRSVLLPGVRRPRPVLTENDRENARRGGRGRGRGGPPGSDRDRGRNGSSYGNQSYGNQDRDFGHRGGYDSYGQRQSYNNNPSHNSYSGYSSNQSFNRGPPQQQNYGGYGGGYGQNYRGRGGGQAPRGGNSYGQQSYNSGGYGGAGRGGGYNAGGGGNSGGRGGYGGYGGYGGGYGGPPPQQNFSGGYGGGYNASNPRGRGRGGRY